MNKTKLNTCLNCKAHIDKSSCSEGWLTVTKSHIADDTGKLTGGYRVTLCDDCQQLVHTVIYHIKLANIEKGIK